MATIVHPEHRGHRLGLAVKLANLEALAEEAPAVRRIVTGNAAVNAPMIAVNDMMGFEVAGLAGSGRSTWALPERPTGQAGSVERPAPLRPGPPGTRCPCPGSHDYANICILMR